MKSWVSLGAANIWADMMCAYYPNGRLLPFACDGETAVSGVDFELLKTEMLSARIDVAQVARYSAVSAQNMLDKLLELGHISPTSYVKRLPAGIVHDREALIDEIERKTKEKEEM